MPTIAELATAVDEIVHRTADDKFDITATLFGCDNDGAYILGSQGDPYELLWRTNRPDHINAIALVVTGWASPTDDEDIAPSKHPERTDFPINATVISMWDELHEGEDTPEIIVGDLCVDSLVTINGIGTTIVTDENGDIILHNF